MRYPPTKVWPRKRPSKKGPFYTLRWYERGHIRQEAIPFLVEFAAAPVEGFMRSCGLCPP